MRLALILATVAVLFLAATDNRDAMRVCQINHSANTCAYVLR